MTRSFALLIITLAIGTSTQAAHACSGTACAAFSASTTYNASNKQVVATVANKDRNNPIRLTFCINVDYHCNGFQIMLKPLETVTKSTPFNGQKPPQKYEVDVVTADFAGEKFTPDKVKQVDTPYGSLSYFAAQESEVGPLVRNGVSEFVKAKDSYEKMEPRAIQLRDQIQKLGSLDDIVAQTRKVANDNPNLQNKSGIMKEAGKNMANVLESYKTWAVLAQTAQQNLGYAEEDLKAMKADATADRLMKEVESQRKKFSLFITASGTLISAGKAVANNDDPVAWIDFSQNLLSSAEALFTDVDYLTRQAEQWRADASRIKADNAAQKFKDAGENLNKIKTQVASVKPRLASYVADYKNYKSQVEAGFNANMKGKGNFASLRSAFEEAKVVKDLAGRTADAAGHARVYMKNLQSAKKDWMVDAAGETKIMQSILDNATWVEGKARQTQQDTEQLLARLQVAYTKVMEATQ